MIVLTPFVKDAKPWTTTWIRGWVYEKNRRPFGPTALYKLQMTKQSLMTLELSVPSV